MAVSRYEQAKRKAWPKERRCLVCGDIFFIGPKQAGQLYCKGPCQASVATRRTAEYRARQMALNPEALLSASREQEKKRTERKLRQRLTAAIDTLGRERVLEIVNSL